MNEEFHKPFIKGLIVVAMVTLFSMVSSRLVIDYYINLSYKTPIFTSQKSYGEEISSVEK